MHSRPPASAYAAAVGMTVAFGLSFVATKYALRGFEPLLLALLRFSLAGGILCVVWRPWAGIALSLGGIAVLVRVGAAAGWPAGSLLVLAGRRRSTGTRPQRIDYDA